LPDFFRWGFTITEDEYYALKHGPILSRTFDLIKGNADRNAQAVWDEFFFTEGYDLRGDKTTRPAETLSPVEEQILAEIDDRYKSKTYREMIDVVHDPSCCPEWSDPGEGSKRIALQDILSSSGVSEDEIAEVIEELERHEEENRYFFSMS